MFSSVSTLTMVQSKLASITAVLICLIFTNGKYKRWRTPMRVLVTGANGCIGSWVVKNLLDRSLDVLIYDLDPTPARLALIAPEDYVRRVAIETGNIEDTAHVKAVVKDQGVTHIVHLAAALMPVCQAQPVAGGLIDVIGT